MLAMDTDMERGQESEWDHVLQLEGAELLIYDLPDDLIGGHCRYLECC